MATCPLLFLFFFSLNQLQAYNISPNLSGFGAVVTDLDITALLQEPDSEATAAKLKAQLHKHKYLHITNNPALPWEDQLSFVELFGLPYDESLHVNRAKNPVEKDPRVAVFSNDPNFGLTSVGVEGFHSDGNVVPIPHAANFLYCEQAVAGGDTDLAPLRDVYRLLKENEEVDGEESKFDIDRMNFVSAHVEGLSQPLTYNHPNTGEKTMFFGLGSLSGLYTLDGAPMTQEETDRVTFRIQQAIDKTKISHKWTSGDLLIMDNLAVAHRASPGTQDLSAGTRIMRRVTLSGENVLRRRGDISSQVEYPKRCGEKVCLVSLQKVLDYTPGTGDFLKVSRAGDMCRYHLDSSADVARINTLEKGRLGRELVEEVGSPHWMGGRKEGTGKDLIIDWSFGLEGGDFDGTDEYVSTGTPYPWHQPSGQPNDCDGPGSEPCLHRRGGGLLRLCVREEGLGRGQDARARNHVERWSQEDVQRRDHVRNREGRRHKGGGSRTEE